MMKIKFIKTPNFKPPYIGPKYKIHKYDEFNTYYVSNKRGPSNNKYLSTSGNLISSDGYNRRSWIGWFKTKKEAETLLKSLGVTYE